MKLHIFAFAILSLRNAVSLFSRFNINEDQLNELDKECRNFFTCCALFLEVNPTVWTIGNVVPVHTRDIFQKYGKGLLMNSMEGREAKHQAQDMPQIPPTALGGSRYFVMNLYHSSGYEKGDAILQTVKTVPKLISLNMFQVKLTVIVG